MPRLLVCNCLRHASQRLLLLAEPGYRNGRYATPRSASYGWAIARSAALSPLQCQVSVRRVAGNGPGGDAGERLLERLLRVSWLPSPREPKVSGVAFSRTMTDSLQGCLTFPFASLSLNMFSVPTMALTGKPSAAATGRTWWDR